MPLNNLFKKIEALSSFDIERETINIINENSNFINDLLRSQLKEGKDSEGKNITIFGRDYYLDQTIFYKERHSYGLGKETRWITNYDTGKFYSSLITTAHGRVFKTESNLPYFSKILLRSGENIMKLNKLNLMIFSNEVLIPQLRIRFKSYQG